MELGADFFEGYDLAFGDRGDAVAESTDGSVAFLRGQGGDRAEAGGDGKEAEALDHDGRAWRLRKVWISFNLERVVRAVKREEGRQVVERKQLYLIKRSLPPQKEGSCWGIRSVK